MSNHHTKMVIAIDPGIKGAIASFTSTYQAPGEPTWRVEKLSVSPQERYDQLYGLSIMAGQLEAPRIAILEDVGGFIGIPQPGSRMFTFGRGYGQLEGFLIALGYQIRRIKPQMWQAGLSLRTRKGESKLEHKRRMRATALDLFPGLKPSIDETDALLILWWHISLGGDWWQALPGGN